MKQNTMRRRRLWPIVRDAIAMPTVLFLVAACIASAGAMWRRTQSPIVTENDAMMLLRTAKDATEREHALGALAHRTRAMVKLLADEAAAGNETARLHLRNIARQAQELSK